MADRQIPGMFSAPWIDTYLVPSRESYSTPQSDSVPGLPISWPAAMVSQAWAPPIFAGQSWPVVSTLAAGGSFTGAERGDGNGPAIAPDQSDQPSNGILPSTMTAGPEVPLPGPNGRISPDQLTYTPEPPRSWGRQVRDVLSNENVRYYLGPGFYDFYRKIAGLFAPFSPGPGVEQAFTDASSAEKALKDGDIGQAALDYGKSAADLGASIVPDVGPILGKATALSLKSAAAGSKAIFAGMFAKTARLDRLQKAIEMAHAGTPMHEVLLGTGWFLDPLDGKWKFELPDDKMLFATDSGWGVGGRFSSIQHPELKKAYPNLQHVYLGFTPGPATEAQYLSAKPGIKPTQANPTEIQITAPLSDRHGATVHELQHAVQEIENFARGGLPDNAYDPAQLERAKPLLRRAEELRSQGKQNEAQIFDRRVANIIGSATNFDTYWRLAGEIEARNAQKRALMTPEQRLAIPPWETMDYDAVPPIVRFRVPPPLPKEMDWYTFQDLIAGLRKAGVL